MPLFFFYRGYDVMSVDEGTVKRSNTIYSVPRSFFQGCFSKGIVGCEGIFSYLFFFGLFERDIVFKISALASLETSFLSRRFFWFYFAFV